MGINVNLPFPGETFKNTLKLDFYDNEGNFLRTDKTDTWYEVVDSRIKWEKDDEALVPHFSVIADIIRIDDEGDKLDESPVSTIYREEWFTD